MGARQENDKCVALKIVITLPQAFDWAHSVLEAGPGQLTSLAPPAGPEPSPAASKVSSRSFFLAQCSARAVLSWSGYSEEESSGKTLLLFPPGCWDRITSEKEFVALSCDTITQSKVCPKDLCCCPTFATMRALTASLVASHCWPAGTPSAVVRCSCTFVHLLSSLTKSKTI